MHQALYRKWRPKTFDDVYGQEHVTSVLRYEIQNNRYSHAYLFCGSRGTGKTTCAKLLAKAVNCLSPENGNPCGKCEACRAIENEATADVMEMDAASNTGVDYIRDIREAVMYAPSMLKNRVYIIDEVHMLSQSAFNALLKTLEEPPSQVIFILATTEQQKIPATILSRCQRFEFRRIPSDVIADRLTVISEEEKISITREAAKLIAKTSQGGMRDAISLLELCAGEGKEITADSVRKLTGSAGKAKSAEIAEAVLSKNADTLFKVIGDTVSASKELTVFWQELIDLYRDMLVFKTTKTPTAYLDLSPDEEALIKSISDKYPLSLLVRHCTLLEEALVSMQRSGASKRMCAEISLLKMTDEKLDTYPEGLTARVSALEERITSFFATGVQPEITQSTYHKPVSSQNGNTDTPAQDFATPRAVAAPHSSAQSFDANFPTKSTATSFQNSDTVMFKKSVIPEKLPEIKSSPKENQNVRQGLKVILWWVEAVKKIGERDASMAPFIKGSKAFENDGKITVKVEGSIAMLMLNTPEMKKTLSDITLTVADKRYLPGDFEFVEVTPEKSISPIDELSDN